MIQIAGKVAVLILTMSFVGGWSGNMGTIADYIGVPGATVRTQHDDFTVHDREDEGRMMVVASFEATTGESFLHGRAIDTGVSNAAHFEDAARAYLDQTGREACGITSISKVINSQYEVTYGCG